MATEKVPSLTSPSSLVEDVQLQQGTVSDVDSSRKEEEDSRRRYEAASWLRKMVGVVLAKDLPAEPSENHFRVGLRNGIILCNVINRVEPGTIPKVVEAPNDIPDGGALVTYRYFENVRNFLTAVEQIGLPTFDASDFEQDGNAARIVDCVLALKVYSEGKQGGSTQPITGGNSKASVSGKPFLRKNSDHFTNSISRDSSVGEKIMEALLVDGDIGLDLNDMCNTRNINMLVHTVLSGKRQDEVPHIVESMLIKVVEEYERRLACQIESIKVASTDSAVPDGGKPLAEEPVDLVVPDKSKSLAKETAPEERQASSHDESTDIDDKKNTQASSRDEVNDSKSAKTPREKESGMRHVYADGVSNLNLQRQHQLLAQQQSSIKGLKHSINAANDSMKFLQMKYVEDMSNLGNHLCRLAHAASGYQNVLRENRKLYNLVQDLKGNIRVYCRVRPFLPGQQSNSNAVEHHDEGSITVLTPPKYCKEGRRSFTFNRVFGPRATQAEVYADTQPLVRSVLDGFNVCIFAYGQTGTGKTHTMSGPNDLTEETFGVNYRALNDLFHISDQRKETVIYEVSVQMMEIYNEQVRDLLATDGSNKRLEIRNSSQNGINVPDANRLPVSTTADVINLMNLGQKNRAVSSTALNDRSSRSHSCLTVHVLGKDLTSGATLRGCMHLVDLAGSERVEKSEVTGERLKEAVHINKSLSALGDVISSLAQKGSHVPYRNSKLTQLLQDSLGGQAKTLMFVHISPDPIAISETLSTLKFAERVSTVELGAARVNKDGSEVKELKEQIAHLKAALAKKEEESDMLSTSPDSQITKSSLSSPAHPCWRAAKDVSRGRRSPMEDVANSEADDSSVSKPREQSLDPEDLSAWPPLNIVKEEANNGEWIDNMAMKQDPITKENQPQNQLAPTMDSQYADVLLRGRRGMSPASDDVEDFEVATTDSSELDFQAPTSIPRALGMSNGFPSKLKKPQSRVAKATETRSMIPAPSSIRKPSPGTNPPAAKNGRPVGNAKRKNGISK